MIPKATVTFSVNGINAFQKAMKAGKSPAITKTLKQWGVRYRGWITKRFILYSKGGGDWKPLSPATIARRRKGKGKSSLIAILRDTGQLLQALAPMLGQPGQLERHEGFSVVLGVDDSAMHMGSSVTIGDIAAFHNYGMGHNPVRLILAMPDNELLNKMAQDAERNLSKEAKDFIG
jgi:hypothetical protein